jgi:hypothetical protein
MEKKNFRGPVPRGTEGEIFFMAIAVEGFRVESFLQSMLAKNIYSFTIIEHGQPHY